MTELKNLLNKLNEIETSLIELYEKGNTSQVRERIENLHLYRAGLVAKAVKLLLEKSVESTVEMVTGEIDIPSERWIMSPNECPTSPSGKTMFKCRICGRLSVTPDKWCEGSLVCEQWEVRLVSEATTPVVERVKDKSHTTVGGLYPSCGPRRVIG